MGKHTLGSVLARAVCLVLPLLAAAALPAQDSSFVVITPEKVTLLVGETATFRLVDQNGQAQHKVSWTLPDREAFQAAAPDDQLTVTAKHPGDFRIGAQSAAGSAAAAVTVIAGTALPEGTARWSEAAVAGCSTTNVTQAEPTANGPALYEESQCEDGQYVTAYRANGVQLWRRKVGADGAPAPAASATAAPGKPPVVAPVATHLDLTSASVCDAVSVGTPQQKIHELLDQRHLSFNEGPAKEHSWTVEESNAECKFWFDEKSVLTKKRKMFLN